MNNGSYPKQQNVAKNGSKHESLTTTVLGNMQMYRKLLYKKR